MATQKIIQQLSVITALTAYATAIQAQDAATLTQPCLDIKANHERLDCYDNAARQLGLNAVAGTVTGDTGDWYIKRWRSPIDDSLNVIATLAADDTIPDQLNIGRVRPTLSIRCKEGSTDAFITWQRFINTEPVFQTIRFDKNQAYQQEWSISTDREALFAYKGDLPIFTANLMGSRSLYMQVTPYGDSPVGVHFYLKGGNIAVLNVLEACGKY